MENLLLAMAYVILFIWAVGFLLSALVALWGMTRHNFKVPFYKKPVEMFSHKLDKLHSKKYEMTDSPS